MRRPWCTTPDPLLPTETEVPGPGTTVRRRGPSCGNVRVRMARNFEVRTSDAREDLPFGGLQLYPHAASNVLARACNVPSGLEISKRPCICQEFRDNVGDSVGLLENFSFFSSGAVLPNCRPPGKLSAFGDHLGLIRNGGPGQFLKFMREMPAKAFAERREGMLSVSIAPVAERGEFCR